jgi:hypothetical protein
MGMKLFRSLSLFGLGVATMYLFDPRLGVRRRSALKDRLISTFRDLRRQSGKISRNLTYRSRGLFHKIGDRIQTGRQNIPDPILEARIRSKIGRQLRDHPHSFEVIVDQGNVLLEGTISDALYQRINPVIRRIPGVHSVKRSQQLFQQKPAA